MTLISLITAVAAGIAVGLAVRVAVPAQRDLPLWLAPAVGASAAVAGTIAAWLAGAAVGGLLLDVSMQLFFAGTGVMAMLAKAERHPHVQQ